ncbi:hypothetical protein HDU67_008924, partial [Dinochytrium kinnereticum]
MGLFNTFTSTFQSHNPNQSPPTVLQKALSGLAAGALGALIGNPCDLALIRMQADGMLPAGKRMEYRSVLDAVGRIAGKEGVGALWKGAGPTVVRAMALNLGMLSTFSESKSRLEHHFGKNTAATQFGASAIAGFFASFFSLPFDFVKTRLQRQTPDSKGVLPYKGSFDCAVKVVRREGILAFYK